MNPDAADKYYLRIGVYHRSLHGLLLTSFLGLAATGMPIRFNQENWANRMAHGLGGFDAILFFHRAFAVLLTLCFLLHLAYVFKVAFLDKQPGIFWGPSSMVPQPKDLLDLFQHLRWFFGMGPPPRFDRLTYWEKFDYWAVFWGMAIIGSTGYILWFSSFFGRFLPGWLFNIALLIHADEALLAVWFIFSIHFFNSHLRPQKFPMDLVIFTGRVSEKEFRNERPLEYERLLATGELSALQTDAPLPWLRSFGKVVGFSVIAIGFVLFGITLYAFLME
ncbi:MAG: hypothetical protein A3G20_03770 [Acidobacteria bacterium RIFCSPLOWO2_12_FULL_59_11]|nr:MAG: hypothetical protein A3G20_03770 [Acidobacteria bacterium RIFCSPLOWO2_12_FULL_59_11]